LPVESNNLNEKLDQLNGLARDEAENEFMKCCGSSKWAQRMVGARPFDDAHELLLSADSIWWGLNEADWLEAFSRHPKIGERKAEREQAAEAARWSSEEQAGTRDSSSEALSDLSEANRAYERKFGYIYIVCATGKTTEEMLEILNGRLRNDPQTEIRIAAEEQRKITQLRLKKLLTRLESGT